MLVITQWLRMRIHPGHTSYRNYKYTYRQLLAVPVLGVLMLAGSAGAAGAQASPEGKAGACDHCLFLSKPVAGKPDGDKQPLDLFVSLTGAGGKPVEGAKVTARVTNFNTFVDAPLTDVGNGLYMACSFGEFNGKGTGAIRIHIMAQKAGYRDGTIDGVNQVGGICTAAVPLGPDSEPSR